MYPTHQSISLLFLVISRYSELRLIDIPSLKESLPLTIIDLKKNAYKATQQGVKRLMEKWIPSCVKVISDRRDDIEECMPEDEVVKLLPFLKSIYLLKCIVLEWFSIVYC